MARYFSVKDAAAEANLKDAADAAAGTMAASRDAQRAGAALVKELDMLTASIRPGPGAL